jgi:hypothetical protein
MASIQIYPVGLAKRPLIPIEADPFHPIDDGLNRFIRRATLVGILDAKDEDTLLLASKEPIKQSSAHSSDVKKSCRTGRESDTDLVHNGVAPSREVVDIYTMLRKSLYIAPILPSPDGFCYDDDRRSLWRS